MTPEELLNHCERRIPFNVMRNILKEQNMTPHQGWGKTKEIYLKECESSAVFTEQVLKLKKVYKQHLLSGEKYTRLFKVSPDILQKFIDDFNTEKDADSPFADKYPFPLADVNGLNTGVDLLNIRKRDRDLRLGFCSLRKIEEQIQFDISDLDSDTKSTYFNGFQELYGKRSYKRQLFDFVFINAEKGYIELRVDCSSNLSVKDRDESIHLLKRKFNKIVENTVLEKVILVEHNLYPKIEKLYKSDDGRVSELAFLVSTGAVMHERMRSKDIDIRVEDFHCGGMDAVDTIEAYKIAVEWTLPIPNDEGDYKPELMLSSTLRESYEAIPALYNASISKCANELQYNKLMNKLL